VIPRPRGSGFDSESTRLCFLLPRWWKFGAYILCLYLVPISGAYIWCLYPVPIFLVPISGAYIWYLYKFEACVWCLCLEPISGAYIWSLYLVPIFGASCVGARGAFCSKAPNKGTKWCFYLVPLWLGALLSGAFLKVRCSALGACRPTSGFRPFEVHTPHHLEAPGPLAPRANNAPCPLRFFGPALALIRKSHTTAPGRGRGPARQRLSLVRGPYKF
jgi:hypothetical protein